MRALLLAGLCAACTVTEAVVDPGPLAGPRMTSDFETYSFRRVGLVPVSGEEYGNQTNADLEDALHSAFSASGAFEVVALQDSDLPPRANLDAVRRGWYEPRTILQLAKGYALDGVLVARVTERQAYTPQRLGVTIDLVACETGQVVWSAAVHLDGASETTRQGMQLWAESGGGDVSEGAWEAHLTSPLRFAQFASRELARVLP